MQLRAPSRTVMIWYSLVMQSSRRPTHLFIQYSSIYPPILSSCYHSFLYSSIILPSSLFPSTQHRSCIVRLTLRPTEVNEIAAYTVFIKHICGLHPVNKIDWSICIEKQVRKNLGTSGTWTCIYCLPGSDSTTRPSLVHGTVTNMFK